MKLNSNIPIFLGVIAACLIGCDSFENDTEPQGEAVLDLETTVVALPGTSLFIDLSDKISTSEAVAFGIDKAPTKGTAKISESAILNYAPNDNFLSGDDFLVIKLINESGSILDLDSIVISMEDSLGNIPCFNGALSDYYQTIENSPLTIEPILNDGYCVDETSGAVINFTSEPSHGELESVALFVYQYLPDSGFIGTDSFMYELELIDDEGNSELSLAQVNIEVINPQDTIGNNGCIVIYPEYITLETPFDQYYTIDPFTNISPACSILDWELDILSVTNGEAVASSGGLIQYYPANYTSADTASIEYSVAFLDSLITNTLVISFYPSGDSVACDSVLLANDDFYQLGISDSLLVAEGPYELYPMSNDIYCNEPFIEPFIEIIAFPDLGTAEVTNSNSIIYESAEEFSGTRTTSLLYQLCDGIACDTATVTIEITK